MVPYFFKSDDGHNVTVNGEWAIMGYRAIINYFFVPELEDAEVEDLWFQQGRKLVVSVGGLDRTI